MPVVEEVAEPAGSLLYCVLAGIEVYVARALQPDAAVNTMRAWVELNSRAEL